MSATRKLAAIFYADVAGYSRLTGVDEEGTHRRVMSLLDDVTETIGSAGGTVLRYAGDAILATFPSVMQAVDTSVAIQTELSENNINLPVGERVNIRIGINLGDVIEDRGEVYGDDVNIAARLEAAAVPGGICISSVVWEQYHSKSKSASIFTNGGEQNFKNIDRPIHTFHWFPDNVMPEAAQSTNGLALPDKPSIAVLPFDNMSGDPEQEYFADGITEDLITDLSKLSGLLVIGRNSSFVYKGKSVDLKQVGRELGVHYVLEGSVRKAGNRVRINAQLIDALSGYHVWAERHDSALDDIFELQDEITEKILSALSVQLTQGEQQRLGSQYTDNAAAHDWFMRGRIRYREPGPQVNAEAHGMLDQALALDPNFAWALAIRSYVKFHAWFFKWNTASDAYASALADAKNAVVLDENLAAAHTYLGWIQMWEPEGHVRALAEHEKALSLDPNFPEGYIYYSSTLIYSGRPELAVEPTERAIRLDPHYPPIFLINFGNMYLQMGRYAEAKKYLKLVIKRAPDFPVTYMFLAAVLAAAGDEEGARKAGSEILKRIPGATATSLGNQFPYKNPDHLALMINGLRTAGLSD